MDERKAVAMRVMEKLEQAGFQAYLVGGCVRDEVLGRVPQDYDIATDARPEQVEALFAKTVPTGIKHGTVTVIERGIPLEVTTFRTEAEYLDRRRPSQVEFVSSLKQDLARRDFTFNAMAKNREGRLIDYFSGIDDLKKRKVRTVGDPYQRFREDALRMVRAARFVAQFEFSLDRETEEALSALKQECVHLSVERVVAEFEKMWKAKRPSYGIAVMVDTGLIHCLPPFHRWKVSRTWPSEWIARFDWTEERVVRWCYLLYLWGTRAEELPSRLADLKLSSRDRVLIQSCLVPAVRWKRRDPDEWKRQLLDYGLESILHAHALAGMIGHRQKEDPTEEMLREWWKEMPIKQMKELVVSGRDLLEQCGGTGGPWVGKALRHLFEQVALGNLPNRKEVLVKEGCRFGKVDSQ